MDMLVKMELTKKQAEVIQILAQMYNRDREKTLEHFLSNKRGWNPYINEVTGKLTTEEMIRILYCGYEIKKEPVDHLRDYYNSLDKTCNEERIKRETIRATLRILEVKVEGINE